MDFSSETIRSRQNRAVVELEKLNDRREREATGSFRFDGIKLAAEAIGAGLELPRIFLRQSSAETVAATLREQTGKDPASCAQKVLLLEDGLFDRVSEEKSPEGVICVAKYIDKLQKKITIYSSNSFSGLAGERIVLLESVRDPANVGAMIRSAAALGVDRLIMSADCADVYHSRAVRASMGTLFRQRIDRTDRLTEVIGQLRESGRRVFAAALDPTAQRLGTFRPEKGDCVVIGNEGHGLREETVRACGNSVYIPMSERAESLNAAVAAAILMWEFAK